MVRYLLTVRIGLIAAACLLAGLLLGPFSGFEQTLGLGDKFAHALAFYCVTLGAFVGAPQTRRTDLAFIVFLFASMTEALQGFTGRTASLLDLAANTTGILAATAPVAIERWRYAVRKGFKDRTASGPSASAI